ncbi:MAG: hypothetical protein K6U14_10050 [Firmicutes bacterium]|nr:hypothetical protein [Alicyclobacillaceae bacterium]MCL6497952.1 hypothetical protein [Bacillota bacterium]
MASHLPVPPADGATTSPPWPPDFVDYLKDLQGARVRLSVLYAVDHASTITGVLVHVGSNYLVVEDPVTDGILPGLARRLALPLTNIGGVARVPRTEPLWSAVATLPLRQAPTASLGLDKHEPDD